MSQHTPGPWNVDLDRDFILGGDTVEILALNADGTVNREVASCMLSTDDHPDGPEWLEDAANARLIAAAPDLLAAAVEYLDCLRVGMTIIADRGIHSQAFRANSDQQCAAIDALKAAVARAKGES